jgi:tRNA threonylcarbamoyladenosine biosynthesis protein TsaB
LALILNIDTATEKASICVSDNGEDIGSKENTNQKEHASFVHIGIKELLAEIKVDLKQIDAIAITSGPGSYTGLRVGMATAKGLCYSLGKPLIAINTLQVMTKSAIEQRDNVGEFLYCPMIDARRMEVFAGIYTSNMEIKFTPKPVILDESSFKDYLEANKVLFFGNGSLKFKAIQFSQNSIFIDVSHNATDLGKLAEEAFAKNDFSDVSYSEPEYLKNFHNVAKWL